MTILDTIRTRKEEEVRALRATTTLEQLRNLAEEADAPVDVRSFLGPGMRHVIAEIKRASPSRGPIQPTLDPAAVASEYVAGGASAVSVLTDTTFFRGSADDLRAVRRHVRVPLVRKDFIIDESQVLESRALGADIILLIVRLLSDEQLVRFREVAESLSMTALVEVHTSDDVTRAVTTGASMIGVNNRDLSTFEVSRQTSLDLRTVIPSGIVTVSESGILEPAHAAELFEAGFDAVLIGEGLVTAVDKESFIRQARGS